MPVAKKYNGFSRSWIGPFLVTVILLQNHVCHCEKTDILVHRENDPVESAEALEDGEITVNFNLSRLQNPFEGRGNDKKLLRRILPLFIMPFLIQSAIIPMFLSTLKMMLMKSLMVGKLALLLIAINAIRTSNAFKNRGEERLADVHYGYHGSGMEEYGAYINRHL